jgi:hypothetical protein
MFPFGNYNIISQIFNGLVINNTHQPGAITYVYSLIKLRWQIVELTNFEISF